MAVVGSPNYRVGLVIARAQPPHNGHLRAVSDALMKCDEVIFCVRNYDTAYFDYNLAQKAFRALFGVVDNIAFFGIKTDTTLGTPKLVIQRVLEKLEEARYNMPTHYFSNDQLWIDGAKELQLDSTLIGTLPDHNSDVIRTYVETGNPLWKEKVPHGIVETIETYIATKERNF